ncbi:hypothetical protein E2C01_099496 [Portunus trituberculatus]|uniref:Uncharacterized protein n=1 Tax=Portunus trituberculatus TaxID=210409 RepID=A0A5B7K3Z7_PORTR|nr:hypothetical protein [Portunus trituberculatus]
MRQSRASHPVAEELSQHNYYDTNEPHVVAFSASSWNLNTLRTSHLGGTAQGKVVLSRYIQGSSIQGTHIQTQQPETRWHLGIVGKQLMWRLQVRI